MAITKSFVEHTMLKASDLNELVTQANGYVHEIDVKKPDTVDISNYISEGDELPLGCYYVYYGNPTHTLAGRYTYTDTYFIAICISHWEHAHTLAIYTKNAQNKYIYYETFRTDQASTAMERYIASLFSEPPVTYEQDGLMTHQDKQLFDDMVTEVFPLTVGVVSSNAGTLETGSSITPSIVLSVTRKGVNIDITSDMVSVSPNDGSLNAATKTYTGAAISSGSKTYQIAVTQGGQTRSIPNQVFKFLPYVYGGELSSKPADAAAVKAQIESWGSSHGVLSDKTNSIAIYSTGVVPLSANNYYLFAVKGSVNLVCRHAGTDAVVTGCTSGTATIQRVNRSGSDSYSYIIVEKSNSAWSFKITNS